MPAIDNDVPEPDTYQFVLRQYQVICTHKMLVNTYAETVESRAITFDGRGQGPEEAHTIFLQTEDARNYLVKIGWLDETERWNAVRAAEEDAHEQGASLCRAVLAALRAHGKPTQAGTLAKLADVPVGDATAALTALAHQGLVVARGNGAIVIYSMAPVQVAPDMQPGA